MTIPEGIKAKALALGLGVEEQQRGLAARPTSLFRFTHMGRVETGWMRLAMAHGYLDMLGQASRRETGHDEERRG
jgi:hypothetical protein